MTSTPGSPSSRQFTEAMAAADQAIKLAPTNGEALCQKASL
ncbi:hypothetical protein [Roseateles saccharophilus]|nr:hypothetical protein [Roseateles saccharophilus]